MLASKTVSMAVAAALLSLNAFAAPGERTADGFVGGAEEAGYSLAQYRYFTTEEEGRGRQAFTQPRSALAAPAVRDGFEFVAGETGSQPLQHKYVLRGARFVHSEECDHAIRMVGAPTPREIEAGRLFSPGA